MGAFPRKFMHCRAIVASNASGSSDVRFFGSVIPVNGAYWNAPLAMVSAALVLSPRNLTEANEFEGFEKAR